MSARLAGVKFLGLEIGRIELDRPQEGIFGKIPHVLLKIGVTEVAVGYGKIIV